MPSVQQQRDKLISLIKQLFQLDQPDLDFGFYKIMHAKSEQVQRFLENDLLDIIKKEFGELSDNRVAEAKAKYEAALKTAKDYGAQNPEEAPAVKEARAEYENAKEGGSPEGDIYDHLWRFFERYYDNGDFLSRRYYARETAGKAAPYAIPYDGREVYLHWANKDQYYIKTSEYLTNFTFNPAKSKECRELAGELLPKDEQGLEDLKVHCRIVEATEGEHGNIKTGEGQQRFFIINEAEPIKLENGELVIQFQYRSDPEKTGQDNTWKQTRLNEAVNVVMTELEKMPEARIFRDVLYLPAPTEKQKDRPLLAKYLNQYTARNTMDYFIHKDLGGFLNRELDFYIKNEIMRLDDIENADAPKVETYLKKIRVLRKIARHLIEFLFQLEEFQKKLWLKKKFITETNYCITLDRIFSIGRDEENAKRKLALETVRDELFNQIVANDAQTEEWIRLFAINEIEENLGSQPYTTPLNIEFLQANDKLVLDTKFFEEKFKQKLLASIENIDGQCDGTLIHSENFQALRLLKENLLKRVNCIYIDPPYNTDGDGFNYKDSYKHSTWASMIKDRLSAASELLSNRGVIFTSINEIERFTLDAIKREIFSTTNRVEDIIWVQDTVKSNSPAYSTNHEYISVYAKNLDAALSEGWLFKEPKPGYREVKELINKLNGAFPPILEIEEALKNLYREHKVKIKEESENNGGSYEEAKRNDPWKGIYNYWHAEYRTSEGTYVDEEDAKAVRAKIFVWREVEPSMPSGKQAASTKDPLSPNYRFYIPINPKNNLPCRPPKRGWAFPMRPIDGRESFEDHLANNRIYFKKDEGSIPQIKYFLDSVSKNVSTSVIRQYADGDKELGQLFENPDRNQTPKPTNLIKRLVSQTTTEEDAVLDFFAGTGTTGHSIINLNREDGGNRKYFLFEMGPYFDIYLKPRIQKAIYSENWRDGKPVSRVGTSHFFKYFRLESYEDALNNLTLDDGEQVKIVENNGALRQDYMLKYWLDIETLGSPSLLNIDQFTDPTAYTLKVKKPGTDEYEDKNIDLVETFNWLIGLHVEHMDVWRVYEASFKREKDPELPEDGNTKLVIDGKLKETKTGKYAFRKVEGWVAKTPGNMEDREKVLVVWRKLTGNLEEDNAVLDEWFRKLDIRSRNTEFDIIYVNGSNNLPNLRREDEHWKVRLLEETFHQKMWDIEDI